MTKFAQRHTPAIDWAPLTGRELGSERIDETPQPYRVVACLNVWNDRDALAQTLPTWYDHVDHIIAVDGAYAETGHPPLSTDGTRDYLAALPKVQLLDAGHGSQFDKRNAYLAAGRPGDLLFIIDADELVTGADRLRETPSLDVGWCRIKSPLYRQPYGQPRLIRWQPALRYAGRHHWIYAQDRVLATHQYGGPGFEHRAVPITLENRRGLGHSTERSAAKKRHAMHQLSAEGQACAMPASAASDRQLGKREPLRIVMAALRDDGMAPSRLHTAVNRTTPHASLLFKAQPGPYGVPEALSTTDDRALYMRALEEADVLHFHVSCLNIRTRTNARQSVVMHHHGTLLRLQAALFAAEAKKRRALVLVSNLELLSHAPEGHFLPNVMPVARYRRLRAAAEVPRMEDGFRVAHSPSKPEKKGTVEFLAACERLRARGYPIVPVMCTDMLHAEVLALKATCHAAFDSLWLGMQCSGLEAAAMGLPVIAGDETVASRYEQHFGACPYTFANSSASIEDALAHMMDDAEFREAEATRVSTYVRDHHDEAAVALRYLDLLDTAFGWRR